VTMARAIAPNTDAPRTPTHSMGPSSHALAARPRSPRPRPAGCPTVLRPRGPIASDVKGCG
jgi:hypothetical protein